MNITARTLSTALSAALALTMASTSDRPADEGGGHPTVSSADLFRGGRELVIRHGSEEYRLRITRAGKLILTK